MSVAVFKRTTSSWARSHIRLVVRVVGVNPSLILSRRLSSHCKQYCSNCSQCHSLAVLIPIESGIGDRKTILAGASHVGRFAARWTAGHTGIPGNKEADEEAKKAAKGTTSDASQLPKLLRKPLKRSKTAAIQEESTARKIRWRHDWIALPQYTKFHKLDPSIPSRCFIKLISNPKLSRADTSKVFQLRAGHIPLNAYLFQFKRKESVQCPACGASKETPQHFLLECPVYARERRKLGPKKGELEIKHADILSNKGKMVALALYLKATGRFLEDKRELENKAKGDQTRTSQSRPP